MNSHKALPMPMRSLTSLAFAPLIDLPEIYFFHSDKGFFNIKSIRSEVLHGAMQRSGMEVAVPRFGVQSLIGIIVEMNVEHVFAGRLVEGRLHSRNTLHSCVGGGISHLANLMILTLLGLVFKTKVT